MNKVKYVDLTSKNSINQHGCFIIEPLEIGQGITLGNSLRRTLLSDLEGYGITGVRINDLKHEFGIIKGLREDTLEVLLNLKEIIFKPSYNQNNFKNKKIQSFLQIKGPKIITAGLFNLPKNNLKILNPSQYICTLVDDNELFIELDIEKGKGYRLSEENFSKKIKEFSSTIIPTTLLFDTIFMPIKNVNYKVKLIYDNQGYIKESLIFEITTNGSITPKRSFFEALKYLLDLFSSIFLSNQLIKISKLFDKKN
jgi:DNA-directed RNA polymerase subunit alpha